ncbi:MAG: penicillin-insensitive murein endopeptidase [Deltaproteobacteria bacterium]|nr:penicillin-insensitive murein endopeptidase [Deltaproteobacteria bacterium]
MRAVPILVLFALGGCAAHPGDGGGPARLPVIPALGLDVVREAHCPPLHAQADPVARLVPAPPAKGSDESLAYHGEDLREATHEGDGEPEAPYENEGIDDGEPDTPRVDDTVTPPTPLPSDARLLLTDEQLRKKVRTELASLGSLSLGTPAAGGLVNAVPMSSTPHWTVVDGSANWATTETVDYLTRALTKVYEKHPTAPPVQVGHLSSKSGGPLSPHRSHQSGRDVDVGYFYRQTGGTWYRRANAENLDATRSWELVRALVTETDVEYVFINLSVQKLLKEHALRIGEEPAWIDSLFQYGSTAPSSIIRHVDGHDTHLHVRFFNPIAEELGRRALPYLPERRLVEKRETEGFVPYRIHKGETLKVLAKKFNTTVQAIQRANRLRNLRVVAGRTYLVPQKMIVKKSRPIRSGPRVAVPPRRKPPRG